MGSSASPPIPQPLPWLVLIMLLAALLGGCGRPRSGEQLMATASAHQARGETRAAIIELKNLLQQTPDNGPARVMLGRLYLGSGDVLSADKELRRALALRANQAEVLPLLGRAMLLQGQFDQLLVEIPADETQPQWLVLRGLALLGRQQPEPARALFQQVLVRHPDHPGALLGLARIELRAGRRDAALELLAQALKHHPDDVDVWRLRGDVLRVQGDSQQAMAAYLQARKLRPEQAQTQVDIATLHIQAGRYDAARQELAAARKISPSNLMVMYTQALLDFREGKLGPAHEQLQLVLRAAPDYLPGNLLMGAVLRGQGTLPQAGQYLRKFLDAYPGHVYASKLLASVLLGTGEPERALAMVQPLLEANGQDLEMMALAGEIYMRLRQYRQSAAYFEKASVLAPKATMLHAALAMSHIGLGDNERAVAELELATSLDSKSVRAGTMLVLTHLRNKAYPQALEAVNRMQSQQDDNPMVHNLKGGVLLVNRDTAGARASFERALALDALYLPALDNLTLLDLNAKQPEQARRRLEAALARDQKNADLMTALANLALKQGQQAVARDWLERAQRDHPDALEPGMLLARYYAGSRELPKALALTQKLRTAHPDQPGVLSLLAELQERAGNTDGTLESLTQLAVLQPRSAEVQLRIAAAKKAAQDRDGALQALHKALSLQPGLAQAQAGIVKLLLEQQAYAQALQAARGFQKASPAAPLGYKLEGDVLAAQKQLAPALARYQKAWDLQPSGALLIPWHAAMVQAGKSREARARVEQWLREHNDDLVTLLYYASSLMAEKDYAASSVQFEKLLSLSPGNVVALNNLAWLCQQRNDTRALAYAEQAYKLAPNEAAVMDTLGWLLAEQGQLARALPLLKQAAAHAPGNTELGYHLGVALGKSGDKQAGREQLEKMLAVKDFSHRDAARALLAQW